jgi:hypothetical protein
MHCNKNKIEKTAGLLDVEKWGVGGEGIFLMNMEIPVEWVGMVCGGFSGDKNSAGYRYIRGYISIRVEMCVCVCTASTCLTMQISCKSRDMLWYGGGGGIERRWRGAGHLPMQHLRKKIFFKKINRKNKIKDMDASVTPSQRTVTAQPVDL